MRFPEFFKGRTTVRWGIIGCGDVTEVKSGPGFQKAAGSALVAVMRRRGDLAADYARRHGVPRWYDDARALIADPEVDAVYVATPPETHLEYALQVAAAGKPAYVEKPMARHAPECDRMVAAFAAARLPLYVAYYRRRLPRFLTARELITSGALGRVTSVRYHFSAPRHTDKNDGGWRVNAAVSGGGHFVDIGSHAVDLLDFFFGPLTAVSGVAGNHGGGGRVEDTVAMSFLAGDGVPGAATWNFASAEREDTFLITGTAGERRRGAIIEPAESTPCPAAVNPVRGGRFAGPGRVPEHRGIRSPGLAGHGCGAGGVLRRAGGRLLGPAGKLAGAKTRKIVVAI